MSDRSFVEAIVENTVGPEIRNDRIFTPKGWEERRAFVPKVAPLMIFTLTGLRDYLDANIDHLAPEELMLTVDAPDKVTLRGALGTRDDDYTRTAHIFAEVPVTVFPFDQYLDAEQFTIKLQTHFVSSEERNALLLLIASIRESDVRETLDDGVAQEVKTARGVVLSDRTKVPSPVTLAPYRTFREVEQPASQFVLRLKSGDEKPRAALFEADGGTWRLEAVANVAAWLRANTSVKVVA